MRKLGIVLIALLLMSMTSCSALIRWQWKLRGVSEEGRRTTFEETKSYNEGKEQDLLRYRLEYLKADSTSDKEAIAGTIRLMFADYDSSKLAPELQNFLKDIMY